MDVFAKGARRVVKFFDTAWGYQIDQDSKASSHRIQTNTSWIYAGLSLERQALCHETSSDGRQRDCQVFRHCPEGQSSAGKWKSDVRETEVLDRFLYHPGAETACAHPNPFGSAIDQRTNGLKIRSEDSVGLIIGMADIMPGLMALATNLTYKSHDLHSFSTD